MNENEKQKGLDGCDKCSDEDCYYTVSEAGDVDMKDEKTYGEFIDTKHILFRLLDLADGVVECFKPKRKLNPDQIIKFAQIVAPIVEKLFFSSQENNKIREPQILHQEDIYDKALVVILEDAILRSMDKMKFIDGLLFESDFFKMILVNFPKIKDVSNNEDIRFLANEITTWIQSNLSSKVIHSVVGTEWLNGLFIQLIHCYIDDYKGMRERYNGKNETIC